MKRQLLNLSLSVSSLVCASAFAVVAPVTTAAPIAINITQACNQGGTRTIVGSFDSATGAVDLTVTLTGCAGRPGDKPLPVITPVVSNTTTLTLSDKSADRQGGFKPGESSRPSDSGIATHDGTVSVKGTFLNTNGSVAVNLLDQINTKVTFDASANTMTRVCTITRVGTLDAIKEVFHGTVTQNNCTMTGDYHENFGLIEHLLRHVTDTQGH